MNGPFLVAFNVVSFYSRAGFLPVKAVPLPGSGNFASVSSLAPLVSGLTVELSSVWATPNVGFLLQPFYGALGPWNSAT